MTVVIAVVPSLAEMIKEVVGLLGEVRDPETLKTDEVAAANGTPDVVPLDVLDIVNTQPAVLSWQVTLPLALLG